MSNHQEVVDLMNEVERLRAELSAYAGQNTNLRNDLVQMGMARDHALAQVEELKGHLGSVLDIAGAIENCECSECGPINSARAFLSSHSSTVGAGK